jgi:mycoredoxin
MLDDNKIPYKWIDIDEDREARDFVEKTNNGFRSVPTIVFPDGSILVEPDDSVLAEKLGVPKPRSFLF